MDIEPGDITKGSGLLTPVSERFVLHWGEMGSRWGVNRTVAQIHALVFLRAADARRRDRASTAGGALQREHRLRELQN